MKLNLKARLTEAAEYLYDVTAKKENYEVTVDKKGVQVKAARPTKQNIKWHARIR